MTKVLNFIGLVVLGFSMSGWAQQAPTPVSASTSTTGPTTHFTNAPTFSERYPRYKLSASDAFDVMFEYTPEWNQSVTVQPDGYVTLRSVGDIYVSGMTVEQATEKMRDAYSKILNKPVISLNLRDFQRPYFIADGQVNRPGKFELRGDTTATQAIAMAGGFNSQFAKHSQVILFRRVDDQWVETKVINMKAMRRKHDLSEDVHLRPGDMLYVPKNASSKLQQWIPVYSVNLMGAQTRTF